MKHVLCPAKCQCQSGTPHVQSQRPESPLRLNQHLPIPKVPNNVASSRHQPVNPKSPTQETIQNHVHLWPSRIHTSTQLSKIKNTLQARPPSLPHMRAQPIAPPLPTCTVSNFDTPTHPSLFRKWRLYQSCIMHGIPGTTPDAGWRSRLAPGAQVLTRS